MNEAQQLELLVRLKQLRTTNQQLQDQVEQYKSIITDGLDEYWLSQNKERVKSVLSKTPPPRLEKLEEVAMAANNVVIAQKDMKDNFIGFTSAQLVRRVDYSIKLLEDALRRLEEETPCEK